jgi:hypothetical protein
VALLSTGYPPGASWSSGGGAVIHTVSDQGVVWHAMLYSAHCVRWWVGLGGSALDGWMELRQVVYNVLT